MLIHPWDDTLDQAEWETWLNEGHDFGQLVVNGLGNQAPHVIPTHFVLDGKVLLVHLARPNPVWGAIHASPHVVMAVSDDYAYIPSTWRAKVGHPDEDGVPTSYYAAIQFSCTAEIVDDPHEKAELLRRQLAHFQPDGGHAPVAVGQPPYGRMLSGIRGLRLQVESVVAKFKYDDHNPVAHRRAVAQRLDDRATGRDKQAASQQRRRTAAIGEWRAPST
jgi:transcriptional regulator